MLAEQVHDLIALTLTHQAVVDIHTGQLVADGFVDEHGNDRAVDAAGEATNDLLVANLLADFLDLGFAEAGHGPFARTATDFLNKILDQLRTVRGVYHFRVELYAIETFLVVGDNGKRRAFRRCNNLEAFRQAVHMVAVAHPNLFAVANVPDTVKQRAGFLYVNEGAAELLMIGACNAATHLRHHRLLAITDAEDGQAHLKQALRRTRRILMGNACRAATEDDTGSTEAVDDFIGFIEGDDFTVNTGFTHAARNKLGYL